MEIHSLDFDSIFTLEFGGSSEREVCFAECDAVSFSLVNSLSEVDDVSVDCFRFGSPQCAQGRGGLQSNVIVRSKARNEEHFGIGDGHEEKEQ